MWIVLAVLKGVLRLSKSETKWRVFGAFDPRVH